MKFQVTNIQNSMITTELFPVNGEPHNVKFSHVKCHRIFFQVSHLPRKSIAKWLADNEPGEVVEVKGFIKSVIQVKQTVLQFVLCYKVKTSADFQPKRGLTNQYVVTEKEKVFAMQATKDEIVRLVEPYLFELERYNEQKSADGLKTDFMEWAHPLRLEDVIATLTEDQKKEAAKLLKEHFAA